MNRDLGDGWARWALPTQVLVDQLTLYQPEGQFVPLTLLLAHPNFGIASYIPDEY